MSTKFWYFIPLVLILALIVMEFAYGAFFGESIENFEISTEEQIEGGASGIYDRKFEQPTDGSGNVTPPTPTPTPPTPTPNIIPETDIRPICKEKHTPNYNKCRKEMEKCPIEWHPDIDRYILKTSIPPKPDMDGYIKKTDIPPYPDMNDYIKKTDIPKCPACPTCPMCPNANDININPSKPKPESHHHKHHRNQNDYHEQWNEANRTMPSDSWGSGHVSPFTDSALSLPEDTFQHNYCKKHASDALHQNPDLFKLYGMAPVGESIVDTK